MFLFFTNYSLNANKAKIDFNTMKNREHPEDKNVVGIGAKIDYAKMEYPIWGIHPRRGASRN